MSPPQGAATTRMLKSQHVRVRSLALANNHDLQKNGVLKLRVNWNTIGRNEGGGLRSNEEMSDEVRYERSDNSEGGRNSIVTTYRQDQQYDHLGNPFSGNVQ